MTIEIIVTKEEIAQNKQFLLLAQCLLRFFEKVAAADLLYVVRLKKKICVVQVTLHSLFFGADPRTFYRFWELK